MDESFRGDENALKKTIELLLDDYPFPEAFDLPETMPSAGMGEIPALQSLAPLVLGTAADLGSATSFAHMDPPTPWITWAMSLWNASLNQNLLHPATSPMAGRIEETVIHWLSPFFGMAGGHMTPGSTVSNLTALWAAREIKGVKRVCASEAAHISVAKSAHLLGLQFCPLPAMMNGTINPEVLEDHMDDAALVLTAGHTSTGAIDSFEFIGRAAWTHIDAAWAGPLRLCDRYADRLAGVEKADSVAISAHKWLFQPKEAGLILFQDVDAAHQAICFGGAYLTRPNVGVLGSHGANAVALLATLLALGRQGIAERIERCVAIAEHFASFVADDARLELHEWPTAGVVNWRPIIGDTKDLLERLPDGSTSTTRLSGDIWLRNVAANPNVDIKAFIQSVECALPARSGG